MLFQNSAIEDHDRSPVGFATNQAAKPLLELYDSLRNGVFQEGVATLLGKGLHPGFDYGFSGDTEGQLGENDIFQSFPCHIHSFPETIGGEEDAGFIILKNLCQAMARSISLLKGSNAQGLQRLLQFLISLAKQRVRSEQDQSPPFRDDDRFENQLTQFSSKTGMIWQGNILGNAQDHLFLVVEGRRENQF